MADLLRSLDRTLPTGYIRFMEDQVLTDQHLNRTTGYMDDQIRLTRVALFGVGIFSGLQVSLAEDEVRLAPGAGVTTDGDLVQVAAATVYTLARPYQASPAGITYLARGGAPVTAWELIPADGDPQGAFALADFAAQAQVPLEGTTALLLVESSEQEQDLCKGANCDNMGMRVDHPIRLLLIARGSAGPFVSPAPSAVAAALQLDVVAADRVDLAAVASPGDLVERYGEACKAIGDRLKVALPKVLPACRSLVGDLFRGDPVPGWIGKLDTVATFFAGSPAGIQYQYDFLKDVVETYAAFRDELFGSESSIRPAADAFPKHLLLGNLDGGAAGENRTAFYPAAPPAGALELDHARFLLRKLDLLIRRFDTARASSSTAAVRITPSSTEETSLEERAIPFYYDPGGETPLHQNWSHVLHRRGMDRHCYSYHAVAPLGYGEGDAASPLRFQIGKYPLLRIEGHLGRTVSEAVSLIESRVRAETLPFQVRTVAIHAPAAPDQAFAWPPPLYDDLHRFHDVLRWSLADQLEDATDFADEVKKRVDVAPIPDLDEPVKVRNDAAARSAAVKQPASAAAGGLRQTYSRSKAADWRGAVADAQKASAELKQSMTAVMKTEFTNPFDTLIGSSHLQVINRLDQIIQTRDDTRKDQQQFVRFREANPGLEHLGGVLRGGTFVLVYDEAMKVIADFTLPYLGTAVVDTPAPPVPDPVLAVPPHLPDLPIFDRPPLPRQPWFRWPDWVFRNGVTIGPSVDARAEQRAKSQLDGFWSAEKPRIDERFTLQSNLQKEYVQVVRDSVQIFGVAAQGAPASGGGRPVVRDVMLDAKLRDLDTKSQLVDRLRERRLDPTLTDPARDLIGKQLAAAETDLAKSATETATFVKTSSVAVDAGSDGMEAMVRVGSAVGKLKNPEAVKSAREGLDALKGGAADKFTVVLSGISR